MQKYYRLRDDNKKMFFTMFEQFCDQVKHGSAKYLTDTLYGMYIVEDFCYADDWKYEVVKIYLQEKVIPHKIEVFNAGIELSNNFPKRCGIDVYEFVDNLYLHDLSKFSANETFGYAMWDFKTKTGDKQGFEQAWNHHKNHNEHHPEYWLSVGRGGEIEPLKMPEIFIAEMVADWIGAGKAYGNTLEQWIPDNLYKFKMHQDSILFLHEVLNCIDIKTRFERGFLYAY